MRLIANLIAPLYLHYLYYLCPYTTYLYSYTTHTRLIHDSSTRTCSPSHSSGRARIMHRAILKQQPEPVQPPLPVIGLALSRIRFIAGTNQPFYAQDRKSVV